MTAPDKRYAAALFFGSKKFEADCRRLRDLRHHRRTREAEALEHALVCAWLPHDHYGTVKAFEGGFAVRLVDRRRIKIGRNRTFRGPLPF